jgi:uncharacterized membrane protein
MRNPGTHPAGMEAEAPTYGRLGTLLRVLLWLGIALVVAGAALELAHGGTLQHSALAVRDLPAGLAALQGNALLTLGLLVFLASPPLGLAYLTGSFLRGGDWPYALAALAVLAIVLGGISLAIP